MSHSEDKEDQRTLVASDKEYQDKIWTHPDQGTTPLHCDRRATDKGCLWIFLVSVCFLVFVLAYGSINGDLDSYFGFTNSKGDVCGTDKRVAHEPYMYMCQDKLGLDEDNPICVTDCPADANSVTFCEGANRQVQDYPTKPYAGKLCMPLDQKLKKIVTSKISNRLGIRFFLVVAEILSDIWPILIAAVIAVLLGFAHLFLLRRFGLCFVWIGFAAMIGVPLILGIKLIHASHHGGIDNGIIPGDERAALFVGVSCCTLAFGLSCLVMCEWRDLLVARMTTKAAVECILDTVWLLVEPFLALAVRGLVFISLFVGLLLLTSCQGRASEGFTVSWPVTIFTVLYIAASIWVLQVFSSLTQFVAAFVTEEWFFTTYNANMFRKEVDEGVMKDAFIDGVHYHLGTLALAAFVLPLVRGPRSILGWLERMENVEHGMGDCVQKVFGPLIDFYHKRLECLNNSIYMNLALNALPFRPGAVHALDVLSDDATDVLSMHGATWLIELGGAGGITAVCVAITHVLCTWFPPFSDPSSQYHVANPVLIDLVSAVVCCSIALDFLLVVVHVADCILFCCAVARSRYPVSNMLQEARLGLMSRLNVCGADRSQRDRFSSKNAEDLPNTHMLFQMVTRDRETHVEKPSSSPGMCSSRHG